jgi:putative glutamine amidotransferase
MTAAFKVQTAEAPLSLPLIGVTTYRFHNQYNAQQIAINEAYTQAVAQAGAIPLLIPLGLPPETLQALLPRLDGVLFTGGGDVQPERYASQTHPLVAGVDEDRDRVEIHLLEHTLQARLPFLGICRGLQVINVALGGSLYEDILDQRPNSLRHQNFPEMPRNYLAHQVRVENNSHLASILGGDMAQVNSMHHQGILRLASDLQATAYAPDGIIEAFELPGYPFGLAVQWHPEALQDHAAMRKIFQALADAAAQTLKVSKNP